LLVLQNFLVIVSVMSLLLAADAVHRQQVDAGLRASEQQFKRLDEQHRRQAEELQLLFDVAPVGLLVARDPECRLITCNPACAALLGTHPAANISLSGPEAQQLSYYFLKNGKRVPPAELPLQFAARSGLPVHGQELEIVRGDGKTIHAHVQAAPLYDTEGEVRGSLGVLMDLTDRKRTEAALREQGERLRQALSAAQRAEREIARLNAELEQRVLERTAQLQDINKELEAFSYSVSHDLRAPLRSIRGFNEVLLQRCAAQLDARGQEFIKRSCEAANQMDKLIDDLLRFSRLGRSEMHWQPVHLSALAESIAAELQRAEPERLARFAIAPELRAWGDERLLRVVLDNLLRNAWKFTSKRSKALIEFGAVDGAAFFVRDNGAGFDLNYASKLFGVFQRLHSASEFEGTGIGLATVQRLVHRHGGRVWAEGAVEQGATFYFTLPPRENFETVKEP
jgi:signal transduction histidine kinase